eukprot:TRINITY_DN1703_c0_g4_i1.p1 TRINITY_DN1703_c0_g4~~TRINITY_DN1703_c0_g4_i1.p1  ORF type:complete len:225 (-),score=64.54 TRINITY_DN1703_c0_g4_i1:9-683(-)
MAQSEEDTAVPHAHKSGNSRKRRRERANSTGEPHNGDCTTVVSPFEEVSLALCISLLPHALSDIFGSIRKNVYKLLMHYNRDVGGVIVALGDIRMADGEHHGRIMEEMPHLHFNIEANAQVFRPRAGALLNGRVMKVSGTHVSMLVCGIFNASIYAGELEGVGYAYSDARARWERRSRGGDGGSGGGGPDAVEMGTSLDFTVRRLHQAQGLISVLVAAGSVIIT